MRAAKDRLRTISAPCDLAVQEEPCDINMSVSSIEENENFFV